MKEKLPLSMSSKLQRRAGAQRKRVAERDAYPGLARATNTVPKPDLKALTQRFHFDLEEGTIWIDDRRVLVLHGEWLAELRRELIALVGPARARGVLTRLGYASGCRDGHSALKAYRHGSVHDAIISGGQLHALQGTVAVTPLVYEVDVDSRHCHIELLWKNSMEDRVHAHGDSDVVEAACWMEVGYASGFLSTCLGSSVIAREVQCAGLGQGQCVCVAKFEHEWEDVAEDLRYLQAWSPSSPGEGMPERGDAPRPGQPLPRPLSSLPDPRRPVVGRSAAFNAVAHKIDRASRADVTVLLLGESGVGKSLLAREIHDRSARASQPFIEVNCASIPETLIEAELFGVERGAYTGANTSRQGRFEAAGGGTLFLDEVATLGFTAQGKLLRALQSREFERLGSGKTLHADVRMIAATNENLEQAIKEGRFRLDLYYRLNVFPIEVPSLRDRREDLPLLVEHFLAHFCARYQRQTSSVSPRAYRRLLAHHWPGNIRELENVIERAVVLTDDGELLDVHHLFTNDRELTRAGVLSLNEQGELVPSEDSALASPPAANAQSPAHWAHQALRDQGSLGLDGLERQLVLAALDAAGGDVTIAARRLGLTRPQVTYRLKKWGLWGEAVVISPA